MPVAGVIRFKSPNDSSPCQTRIDVRIFCDVAVIVEIGKVVVRHRLVQNQRPQRKREADNREKLIPRQFGREHKLNREIKIGALIYLLQHGL